MRTQHIEIFESFSIDEHENPEACLAWMRENVHDLGEFDASECVDTLKAFAERWNLTLDYSISGSGHRGEFIDLKLEFDFDRDCTAETVSTMSPVRLWKFLQNQCMVDDTLLAKNCDLTGCCWDESLLAPLHEFMRRPSGDLEDLLSEMAYSLLSDLHSNHDYLYSEESLTELAQANEYMFLESGELYFD